MKTNRIVSLLLPVAFASYALAAGHGHGHGHGSGHVGSGGHGEGHAQSHSSASPSSQAHAPAAGAATHSRPANGEAARATTPPRLTELKVPEPQAWKHTHEVINEQQVGRLNAFNRREFTEASKLPVETQAKALALADGKPVAKPDGKTARVEEKAFKNKEGILPADKAWTEIKPHGLPHEATARAYVPKEPPAGPQAPRQIWGSRHHSEPIESLNPKLTPAERAALPREPMDRLQ